MLKYERQAIRGLEAIEQRHKQIPQTQTTFSNIQRLFTETASTKNSFLLKTQNTTID